MTTEANKALARQVIDVVWNEGALADAEPLLAPDFVNHSAPPGAATDWAAFLRTAATTRTTFPDFHVTVDDLVAEGDLVVAHFTAQGTHQVAWQHPIIGPIAARGTAVRWRGVRLFRIAEGTVTATWVYTDSLALLQQLGALPGLAESIG
jgi:predicted ester cyclase